MNDSLLLFTGIGVFGLMLIGVILTVTEFALLDKRRKRGSSSGSGTQASSEARKFEDRD